MVNMHRHPGGDGLDPVSALVLTYALVVLGTIAVLAVLSRTDSGQATPHAWGHAVIVGVFAVLLPVRLRAARRGSRRARAAIGVIAAVLVVANVVEALIPGFLPTWMRIEMAGIAALLASVVLLVLRGGWLRRPG